jgi:predicted phosphodiesterase
MRIGVFTDAHYSSHELTCKKRCNRQSLRKIEQAYAHFEEKGCELIVCLGDLIDKEDCAEKVTENLRSIARIVASCPIPTVCLMGNHDAFALEADTFYSVLGLCPPHDRCIHGRRLVFLDTCYFEDGRRYAPGDTDWTNSFLPDAALLRERLLHAPRGAFVFAHPCIDPAVRADHRVRNADRIFEILAQSGTVRTVFEGHYHAGAHTTYGGVEYVTLPAMCEVENGYQIFEI